MPIVDIFRRLALTSGLLVIPDPTVQLLVALAVSVSFVVAFREWKPFYEIETDSLFYICGKLPLHSIHISAAPPHPTSSLHSPLVTRLADYSLREHPDVYDYD